MAGMHPGQVTSPLHHSSIYSHTHSRRTFFLIMNPLLDKWNSFQPSLTQMIHSDVHLEAIDGFCVWTHHHAGVVDEHVKLVDLWRGGHWKHQTWQLWCSRSSLPLHTHTHTPLKNVWAKARIEQVSAKSSSRTSTTALGHAARMLAAASSPLSTSRHAMITRAPARWKRNLTCNHLQD